MSSFSSEAHHQSQTSSFPSPFVSPWAWVAADQRQMGTPPPPINRTVGPASGASSVLSDWAHNLSGWAGIRRLRHQRRRSQGMPRANLARTGPCTVIDRISISVRRLYDEADAGDARRPASAMAAPVFAPVLASLLPSVLLPPAGCDCSGVGCGCSAVGWGCSEISWGCSGVGWGCSALPARGNRTSRRRGGLDDGPRRSSLSGCRRSNYQRCRR